MSLDGLSVAGGVAFGVVGFCGGHVFYWLRYIRKDSTRYIATAWLSDFARLVRVLMCYGVDAALAVSFHATN